MKTRLLCKMSVLKGVKIKLVILGKYGLEILDWIR